MDGTSRSGVRRALIIMESASGKDAKLDRIEQVASTFPDRPLGSYTCGRPPRTGAPAGE
jgi:hypothetical protein